MYSWHIIHPPVENIREGQRERETVHKWQSATIILGIDPLLNKQSFLKAAWVWVDPIAERACSGFSRFSFCTWKRCSYEATLMPYNWERPPFVQKESVSLQESYRHKIIFENNKGAGIRVCSKIVGVFRWIYRLDRQRSGAAHYSDKTNKWWVMGFHPCWVWGHWKI